MEHDAGFADAINRELDEQIEVLRRYGGLLAQSGAGLIGLEEFSEGDAKLVCEGYYRQLRDYPNG